MKAIRIHEENWMKEIYNMEAPEADLVAVANHDFRGLATPLLVACRDQEQLTEFVFREGLMCSEVKRLAPPPHGSKNYNYPVNKILILLPEWFEDRATSILVDRWVGIEDRYTVQLNSPRPVCKKRINFVPVVVIGALIWLLFLWLIFR